MKKLKLVVLLSLLMMLSGCGFELVALGIPAAFIGANYAGIGAAKDNKLVEITSKNFGVDKSLIKITNVKREKSWMGTTIYYDVQIKGQGKNKTKNLRCSVDSMMLYDSSPMCAKPGESLIQGSLFRK